MDLKRIAKNILPAGAVAQFKRAKWNEFAFGDAVYHRERLARIEGF